MPERAEFPEASGRAFYTIITEALHYTRILITEHQISLKVGAACNHEKVGKYLRFTITDNHVSRQCDKASLTAEAQLDGISVTRSSEPALFSADDTVRTYKGLVEIETAFRCEKSMDLCIRPIRY